MPNGDQMVARFDKKVGSLWVIIALGAAKSIEAVIVLLAAHLVTVTFAGIDITTFALYWELFTTGTTLLIFVHSLKRPNDSPSDS